MGCTLPDRAYAAQVHLGCHEHRGEEGGQNMTEKPEELWTAAEVSALTKLAKSTIYEGVRDGVIPHLCIGGAIRFRPSEVKAWLDGHAKPRRPCRTPDGEPQA